MEHHNQYLFGDNVNLWLWWSKSPALYYAEATSISTQPCRHFSGVTTRYKLGEGILLAGFLSRPVVKDCELSPPPPPLEVVEGIRTNHFLSVPDHQFNETQRERERERGRGREGGRDLWLNTTEVAKHNLGWLPICKRWCPSSLPSEPLQLRLKYYLNNWKNPQWQGQVRPSFCLEHLTSPK